MQLPEYFIHLYKYNYWANQLTLKSAEALSAEQFFQPQGHGWDSVQRTLAHMMNAEWIWLQRWQGNSPKEWLSFDDFPTVASIRTHWAGIQCDVEAFVAEQTPEGLQRVIAYTNTAGQSCQAPLWLLLGHLVNHGTHHRSELSAILTKFDVAHRENDLYYQFMIQSGQMEE
jgi:uncharacterized damage-inducible protein DinB